VGHALTHFGDNPEMTDRHNRTPRYHWQSNRRDDHLAGRLCSRPKWQLLESAVAQAKAAARDKAIQVVGGVSVAQQLLDAGLVDELHVDRMPVCLGTGLRSFKSSSLERARLEKISVQEVGARTSLRFRIKQ
jgi:dihydrofolate reductase